MILFLILLTMTLMGSAASLFLKKASGASGISSLLKSPSLYLGGFLYLFSALLNILLLRFMPYSVVLPLTSLTYIWTMILSHHFLGDKITPAKIIGSGCIVLGAILISL